jgi:hypothetical protein
VLRLLQGELFGRLVLYLWLTLVQTDGFSKLRWFYCDYCMLVLHLCHLPTHQLTNQAISAHSVNFPQPQVSYNASKAALIHLKSSLAAEWARYGIRTNTISPGYMDTILNEGDGIAVGRKIWTERNPMGRMGHPSELTGPLVLLCSAAGSYINGADLVVDGKYPLQNYFGLVLIYPIGGLTVF